MMLTYEFPPVSGGIATYTASIASAATDLGHEVTVAVSGRTELSIESNIEYPFTVDRSGRGNYSIGKLPWLLWRTYQSVEKRGFDLIHAVDWPHIMALAYLNRFKKIPFAATIYGTELLMAPDSRQIKYLAGDRFLSAPTKIFAISEFTKHLALGNNKKINSESIMVTPLGVDFERFSKPKGDFDIYSEFAIPRDNKIILTVARLDERKGHRTILKALKRLPSEFKAKISYIIAGSGDDKNYKRELELLADKSDVNVVFAGLIEHQRLPSLYAACDLFCMIGEPHPGKIEGFGLVYLEAAVAGIPSIAGRIGGVPEVVVDNETGILVEPGDISGLAGAIVKMIENDDLRKALGKRAKERASIFSWSECARLTYGIVER